MQHGCRVKVDETGQLPVKSLMHIISGKINLFTTKHYFVGNLGRRSHRRHQGFFLPFSESDEPNDKQAVRHIIPLTTKPTIFVFYSFCTFLNEGY